MGIFDIFKFESSNSSGANPSIDLRDFKFLSDDHDRFENSKLIKADNKGAWRGIRIVSDDNISFQVSIYNMNGNHPVWGDNIQMAAKQMKVTNDTYEKIVLRGYGQDSMGASFSDYGITLKKQGDSVTEVTLHMHDRDINIVYKKAIRYSEVHLSSENSNNEKNINVYQEEKGNSPFKFNENTWKFIRQINKGRISETESVYEITLVDGSKLKFDRNSEIILAQQINNYLHVDIKNFEVYELRNTEHGNFLLYRSKKENTKNTFIITSLAGIINGSSIWFKIE